MHILSQAAIFVPPTNHAEIDWFVLSHGNASHTDFSCLWARFYHYGENDESNSIVSVIAHSYIRLSLNA